MVTVTIINLLLISVNISTNQCIRKGYIMKSYILTMLFLAFFAADIYAQNKFEFNAGVGFSEAISLKAKYGNKMQIGLAQGFAGLDFYQSSIEFYYHFRSKTNPDRKLSFYLMGGLGTTFLSRHFNNHITTLYPRPGLTFRFSKVTGINLDFGPCLFFNKDTDGNYNRSFSSSGSVHFFIKV